MTRLVLHAGAEYADSGAIQRDLVSHRAELSAAGVVLPARDEPASWRETAAGLLRGEPEALSVVAQARAAGAETVLASSDLLADALASPDAAARFAERAAAEDLQVQIVVVVREQVGYINSLYCKRILNLETARGLPEFVAKAVPAHRFDYVASFGAIADTEGLELVALPYPEVRAKGAGRAVVEAAGLGDSLAGVFDAAESRFEPLPGPVLLGAVRLLHKRLRSLSSYHEQGKGTLRPLVRQLVKHAAANDWDTTEYWGWDPAMRRATADEYRDSNAAFAEFVWGTPWPEPWSLGRPQRVDLADLEPPVLHDVLSTIDTLVEPAIPLPSNPSDA